jgi:D-sedoheptulose 7-phosphate isomerase
VIAGLKTARERGLRTIVMTGRDGGEARQYADVLLAAPANLTPRVQEVHLVTYHLICEAVETQVAESRSAPALASNGAGR